MPIVRLLIDVPLVKQHCIALWSVPHALPEKVAGKRPLGESKVANATNHFDGQGHLTCVVWQPMSVQYATYMLVRTPFFWEARNFVTKVLTNVS